jgi:sulfoquinovose isomerase
MSSERSDPPSAHWLLGEQARLLDFAAGSRDAAGGFGWLDDAGGIDPGHPVQTWITARMTYVFALAHLRGYPGAAELVDHGMTALCDLIADHEFGGWYPTIPGPGSEKDKRAYETSFVLLAAAAATAIGRPGAAELLAQAMAVIDSRFWREDDGLSAMSGTSNGRNSSPTAARTPTCTWSRHSWSPPSSPVRPSGGQEL